MLFWKKHQYKQMLKRELQSEYGMTKADARNAFLIDKVSAYGIIHLTGKPIDR